MKTIFIDVDDVICTNHFLPVVNSYLGTNYKEEDFWGAKFEKQLFPNVEDRNKFYDYFVSVDSYENCDLKEGAYESLERLIKNNKVILLTNACHYERTLEMGRQFTDKWKFLLNKLPFFPPENIVFSAQKDLFDADVIIDDRVSNMYGNYKHKLLFTCFHNRDVEDETLEKLGITRVDGWKDVEKYIENINK